MDNVMDFPKLDPIAEMTGPPTGGNSVILDGKLIPHLMMFDRGEEIEFVLQNRLAFGFPRDQARNAATFAAAAMAIGAGFPHYSGGKHSTSREFAPGVSKLAEST